ncbi:ABC transporter permease [Aquabacterium sp.]|uniref:ABC transporter permease n=1 Tax=Aquabacterium sp. TaxID=1872578 RepID=UPI002E359147|nr:FtsX-like permease family protein [Aquabacterium sp.]HEX5312678.1 FtsX-like permease family protein [Aquabacterium sp.]
MSDFIGVKVSVWRWAWTQMRRDWRSGSMRFLLVSVVLAVTALSAVAFFADRIEAGLARDAAQLIGGDAVVVADQPVPDSIVQRARQAGLRVAHTAVLASMARAPDDKGGDSKLVALKSVDSVYPLRGRLQLGSVLPDGTVKPERVAPVGGPSPGKAWVDAGVLLALNLQVGDSLWLGDKSFPIEAVIATEPDRGAGFMTFAPRVMIRLGDLAATQLVQPASRVTYRLLTAGPARSQDAGFRPDALLQPDRKEAIDRFVSDTQKAVENLRGVRVETMDQGRPEMRTTLDRAGLFLRLVALLAGLLSAVAVAMVARDFAQNRLDDCALMRVLGVPQGLMARIYTVEFLLVGVLASAVGLVLGWFCHQVFVALLANLVSVSLPGPTWRPFAVGTGVGILLTLGFGLPSVLQLAQVPPLRVIRRDLGGLKPLSLLAWFSGLASLTGLLLLVARDWKLGGIALGGFAGAVLVFALLTWLLVYLLRGWSQRWTAGATAWALSVRQLTAQPVQTMVQVSALAIGLLALMLLVLLRTDLIDSWRNATPPDAPNRFVINIQPDQQEAFKAMLKTGGVQQFDWYPMARGRLVAINGKAVHATDYSEDRAQRLVEREFNISHAAQAPTHNEVVAGRYVPNEPDAFSVEEGLAKTLGLKLGDRLRFDFAGQVQEGRITSLRKVDWSSMRVNFFVIAPQAEMPQWPITYISAFRSPASGTLDRQMVQAFPNLTVVDVSATLAQIQAILGQVITAVEFLFAFTLAAGLIVLMAGLLTTRERRAADWAIWRAMGATQGLLSRVQWGELWMLGALSGALAASASLIIGWALAAKVFEFEWHAQWWWPILGALVGAILAGGAGWWSLRGVLQRPVMTVLRRAD